MAKEAEQTARKRVEKAMKITGWKPSRLAKEAGIAVSTLTRFLYRDPGYTLSLPTLAKIDEAVRLYLDRQPFSPQTIQWRLEYFGDTGAALEPADSDIITIHVRGTDEIRVVAVVVADYRVRNRKGAGDG